MFTGLESGVGKVVQSFHRALRQGDHKDMLNALAGKAVIFEGGNVERSLEECAGHHFQADVDFPQKMQTTQLELQVQEGETLASAYGHSRIQGKHKDKSLDLQPMETLSLKRQGDDWKMVQIHWSNK